LNLNELKAWYLQHKLADADHALAVDLATRFFDTYGLPLDTADEADLDRYLALLLTEGNTTVPTFRQLMRMMRFAKRNDLFVHLTKYTGGLGVLESIQKRLRQVAGTAKAEEVLNGFAIPPLGTPPAALPQASRDLMERLNRSLDPGVVHDILADNHHGIPKEAFLEEKVRYETSSSLAEYLKDAHARQVAVLEDHMKRNEVWFEQQITQEVLDFVKGNQEVLSARLERDTLFITKIPYDTKAYLEAKDPITRRYYACHCPFARESIRLEQHVVDPHWCSCSAGFHKFPYEILFDRKLKIRCLSNALEADTLCKFAIDLSDVDYPGKPAAAPR
jgi:hypothetical protein